MFRALTVKQPWADLIVEGKKDVENRGWSVNWRGVVLIHSSKEFDLDGYEALRRRNVIRRTPEKFETGAILGAAILRECVPYVRAVNNPGKFGIEELSEWHEPNQIGWYFSAALQFAHRFPISGRQGLWFVRPDLNLTGPDPDEPDPELAEQVVLATLLGELGDFGGSDNGSGRGAIHARR